MELRLQRAPRRKVGLRSSHGIHTLVNLDGTVIVDGFPAREDALQWASLSGWDVVQEHSRPRLRTALEVRLRPEGRP